MNELLQWNLNNDRITKQKNKIENDKIIFTLNINWGKNIHNFSMELIIKHKTKHVDVKKNANEKPATGYIDGYVYCIHMRDCVNNN